MDQEIQNPAEHKENHETIMKKNHEKFMEESRTIFESSGTFGCIWTHSDTFGRIWMRSVAFGCLRSPSEAFGFINSDAFRFFLLLNALEKALHLKMLLRKNNFAK